MITGELKNKIDGLWDIFAAGGLVNPLEVIEQITYLMFIHDLDDSDNMRAKESAMLGLPFQSIFAKEVKIGERTIDGTQLKWSVFHDFPADRMYSVIMKILNEYPNKRIAIVSHGTAISYLLKKWCDVNIVDDKLRYSFKNEIVFDGYFNYCETFKLIFDDENKLIDIKNIKLD